MFKRKTRQDRIRWITDEMVEVPNRSFIGMAARSPNGEYAIAWADSTHTSDGYVGGYRDSGLGSYVLAFRDCVIASGELERPNDGKVSNEGTFILNDWLLGEGLKGVFHAFTRDGESILSHRFEANLNNNGISQDGRLAICQLHNSPSDDGRTLALFDLDRGTLVWQKVPEIPDIDNFDFETADGTLKVHHLSLGWFRFSLKGEFLDEEAWIQALRKGGRGFEVLELGLAELEKLQEASSRTSEDFAYVMEILDSAAERCDYPAEEARAHRAKGELLELSGMIEPAIECYREALRLDEKVGVKRRLAKLVRAVNGQ